MMLARAMPPELQEDARRESEREHDIAERRSLDAMQIEELMDGYDASSGGSLPLSRLYSGEAFTEEKR